MKNIKKWDIYMCDLGDNKRGVQSFKRPCLIMASVDNSLTSIVVPISSKTSHSYMKTHLKIGEKEGLKMPSQLLFEQTTTIAKEDIHNKVAEIKDLGMKNKIKETMKFTLGL